MATDALPNPITASRSTLNGEAGRLKPRLSSKATRFKVIAGTRAEVEPAVDTTLAACSFNDFNGENQAHRIICGTDFSIHAREAVDVAAGLAKKLKAALTLAHFVEVSKGNSNYKALEAMLRFKQRVKLTQETQRLRAGGIKVDDIYSQGAPAAGLVSCAIKQGAELIVVASLGDVVPSRWLIGSVAEQTAHASPVPVLVVRNPKPFTDWIFKNKPLNIVVGHDFSSSADSALSWVAALRRIGRCRITVVHLATTQTVRDWLEFGAPLGSRKNVVEISELLRRSLAKKCQAFLGRSRFHLQVDSTSRKVANSLVSSARARRADLIVVGTNQKGSLRRLCLGSVSRGVLQTASISVACIPVTGGSPVSPVVPVVSEF